ncbi:MAG TPA: YoaK family protein [Ignavibacteria bacterium]|nr:YoaK family protein [Ignavibacteria bacterium]HMR40971.1 YoaK family protein [Ignavibacteria bacterium]
MHNIAGDNNGISRREIMIFLLSAAGGSVDAIIILGFNVLTAAQTGNTILLAVALAQGNFTVGYFSAVSITAYIAGAISGESIIVFKEKSSSHPGPVGWTLLAELILLIVLALFCLLSGNVQSTLHSTVLISLTACAMGMQSAAVLMLHSGPTTTYVTGTITSFSTKLMWWLYHFGTPVPHVTKQSADPQGSGLLSVSNPWIYGISWMVYLTGAILGAVLYLWIGLAAFVIPVLCIGVIVVFAFFSGEEM